MTECEELDTAYRDLLCWRRSCPRGCYCRRHAAFSSSIHCSCWVPPRAIFLVSRSVREDALCVFYSRNRFVVLPAGAKTWLAVSSAPDKLPPSTFLRHVVPKDALRFLRHLEIVFPSFGEDVQCDYCPLKSPQFLEWKQTLQQVKPLLDLPKLTVRVLRRMATAR